MGGNYLQHIVFNQKNRYFFQCFLYKRLLQTSLDALGLGLVEVSVSSVHPEDAQSTKIVKELLEVKVVVTALVLMAG